MVDQEDEGQKEQATADLSFIRSKIADSVANSIREIKRRLHTIGRGKRSLAKLHQGVVYDQARQKARRAAGRCAW